MTNNLKKVKSNIPTAVPLIYKVGQLNLLKDCFHTYCTHGIRLYLCIYISLFVCLFAEKSHLQCFSFTRLPVGQLNSFKDRVPAESLVCSWNPCCLKSYGGIPHTSLLISPKNFKGHGWKEDFFLNFYLCTISCAICLNLNFLNYQACDCSFVDISPHVFFWDVQDRRKQIQLSFVGHFTSESADRSYTGNVPTMLALPCADNSLHLCRQQLYGQCLCR